MNIALFNISHKLYSCCIFKKGEVYGLYILFLEECDFDEKNILCKTKKKVGIFEVK